MAKDDTVEPGVRHSNASDPASRVALVSGHLSGRSPMLKDARRRKNSSALPADYSDILGQITQLQSIARTPDTTRRGYLRQKQAGKLWVRERIHQLLDPGTFREVGSVSGAIEWKPNAALQEEVVGYTPSNNVQGRGFTLALF